VRDGVVGCANDAAGEGEGEGDDDGDDLAVTGVTLPNAAKVDDLAGGVEPTLGDRNMAGGSAVPVLLAGRPCLRASSTCGDAASATAGACVAANGVRPLVALLLAARGVRFTRPCSRERDSSSRSNIAKRLRSFERGWLTGNATEGASGDASSRRAPAAFRGGVRATLADVPVGTTAFGLPGSLGATPCPKRRRR